MAIPDIRTLAARILDHDVFAGLDKQALVDRYDASRATARINQTRGAPGGQAPARGGTIDLIPASGWVIDQPGTYTLAGDLTWAPECGPGAAIVIRADGVVLDLGGHVLSATIQDSAGHFTGILVQDAAGVTIRNGTLAGMCRYGIRAESVLGLVVENVTVSGMYCTNLTQRLLTPAGIFVQGAEQVTLDGCAVEWIDVTADSAAGIMMIGVAGGTVNRCRISQLVNRDGAAQGIGYIGCTGIQTTACVVEDVRTHFAGNIRASGHTVLGFCPIFCIGLRYADCEAVRMTGCADDTHGMSVFLDAEVTVENFTARHVTDGVTPERTGAKATGLEVYGVGVSVTDCAVSHIRAIVPQDRQAAGFSAWGAGITFARCSATDVTACDAAGRPDTGYGLGVGFGWAPDPRPEFRQVGACGVIYEACRAEACQVGFDSWFHVDGRWIWCTAEDCPVQWLQEEGGTRTISGNPGSECNPPITVTLTNIASGNLWEGGPETE
jgi:hypothetical protein